MGNIEAGAGGAHEEEVRRLLEAYDRGKDVRVPLNFAADEQLWLKASGHTFSEFYTDPRVHLEAQLEGQRWIRDNVVADQVTQADRWNVVVQLWMEENEFYGCDVAYQEDEYAWALPLDLEREELLARCAGVDTEDRVRSSRAWRMYESIRDLADGMSYDGLPVHVTTPAQHHGVFTKASEIRGAERLCTDLQDDPDFVTDFLRVLAEKTVERLQVWHRFVHGIERDLPASEPWGFADDSLQMISTDSYARFVKPAHEYLYSAMSTSKVRRMHLCGHAEQHYCFLHREMGVCSLDGPGAFVDHARYLRDLGPEFSFSAQTDHTVLERGSREQIEGMVRRMLTPGARLPGRFRITGFLTRNTPLENLRSCYETARRYGAIEAGPST